MNEPTTTALPARMGCLYYPNDPDRAKTILVQNGVKFGGPASKPGWLNATLPAGWSVKAVKVPAKLRDHKSRMRGLIYPAGESNDMPFLQLFPRYWINKVSIPQEDGVTQQYDVLDGDTVLFSTTPIFLYKHFKAIFVSVAELQAVNEIKVLDDHSPAAKHATQLSYATAEAWLAAKKRDWKDPTKYWD